MPAAYLPDEILGLIFSQIHDKTARPTRHRVSNYLRLTLPRLETIPPSRSLESLLSPNSVDGGHLDSRDRSSCISTPLARFVHSLQGIVEFLNEIEHHTRPTFPLSFDLRGYTKLFSLYLSLISACPHLVAIDLSCDTMQQLNAIFKALKHSVPTLKTVNLVGKGIWGFDDHIAEEALRRSQLRQIQHLVIDNIDIDFTSQLNGSVPILLRSLSIVAAMHFKHVRRALSEDRSTLRTIRLDVSGIDPDRFTDLLSSLSPSFKTLEIICRDNKIKDPPYLGSYEQRSFTSYSLESVAGFESLSSLTNLALRRFQGPSLPFLNVLCTTSPHLNTIDFTSSLWISTPDSSNPTSDAESDHPTRIFPELAVLTNLQKLPHLRYAHPGYLPTIDSNAYPILAQGMKSRNVELEWVSCRPDPVDWKEMKYRRCRGKHEGGEEPREPRTRRDFVRRLL